MRLHSKHATAIAYGTDVPENRTGRLVTFKPGENEVTDEDLSFLKASASFRRHAGAGFFVEVAPPPEDTGPVEPVAEDPRARKTGEGNKAYNARMKALDDAEAEAARKATADAEAEAARKATADAEFLAAFDAMSADEQKAMYETLTDEQKALIDERA